ncbi:MAG TPA: lysylphosphatidylglycerol synthase transmembrane domain-containing protein [Solirubrobacteraceae bacterium]|nr:lysylphosphatidylglycerol synthase transmembrane domain-containing protein [Solirubrobacteraceae bacterium]
MSNQPRERTSLDASELEGPEELSRHKLRSRVLFAAGLVLVVVAVVTLLPGLGSLRSRLAHAEPGWLVLGVVLKLASGLGYVVVFRMIFCRRMSWRVSYQIGMSELGANALFPTGGAGGLALGAWALKRGGMQGREIARRTVAFFLLTSVPNVLGVIVLGIALAVGIFAGESNLLLTALPAAIAAGAIVATLAAGRAAERGGDRVKARAGREPSRRTKALWHGLNALAGGVRESVMLLREGNLLLVAGLIGYLVFDVLILWAGFRALGQAPSLAVLSLAYLIGELGGLIPVPGGIGGVDAGLVGTLALYHVPLTAAVGAVLAYRAIALWVPAVAGGTAFVWLKRTLRDEAEALAVCVPEREMDVIGLGRVVVRGEPH